MEHLEVVYLRPNFMPSFQKDFQQLFGAIHNYATTENFWLKWYFLHSAWFSVLLQWALPTVPVSIAIPRDVQHGEINMEQNREVNVMKNEMLTYLNDLEKWKSWK